MPGTFTGTFTFTEGANPILLILAKLRFTLFATSKLKAKTGVTLCTLWCIIFLDF